MRIGATLLVAALLVVAGCSAPNAGDQPTATPERTTGPEYERTTSTDTGPTNGTDGQPEGPPDPAGDPIGWEDGYWHNESIDVDNTDGLTDAEFRKVRARAEARVEVIRNREFTEDVTYKRVRPEQSPGVIRPRENESFLTFEDIRYEALFLVGAQGNGREVFWDGFSNRGAFYDYWNHSAVLLVRDSETPKLNRRNFAHELAHALQDQQFDLTEFVARPTMDGSYARRSVMEGAAKIVEREYTQRCERGQWECIETPEDAGVSGEIPHFGLYGQQLVWYEHGMRFLWDDYRANGTDVLDRFFRHPPNSTEQIIEESVARGRPPVRVNLTDRTGGGWERVRPDRGFPYQPRPAYARNGQSSIATMFIQTATDTLQPTQYNVYNASSNLVNVTALVNPGWATSPATAHANFSFEYAEGWEGDRLHVYRNGTETGFVWRVVWESPADARAFRGGYEDLIQHWGGNPVGERTWRIGSPSPYAGNAYRLSVEGDAFTIVNAPSVAELGKVYGPAGT
jgi:hypothetical protein